MAGATGVYRPDPVIIGRAPCQPRHGTGGHIPHILVLVSCDIAGKPGVFGHIQSVARRARCNVPVGGKTGRGSSGGGGGYGGRWDGGDGDLVGAAAGAAGIICAHPVIIGGAAGETAYGTAGGTTHVFVLVAGNVGGKIALGGHIQVITGGPAGSIPVGPKTGLGDGSGGVGRRRAGGIGGCAAGARVAGCGIGVVGRPRAAVTVLVGPEVIGVIGGEARHGHTGPRAFVHHVVARTDLGTAAEDGAGGIVGAVHGWAVHGASPVGHDEDLVPVSAGPGDGHLRLGDA